MSLLAGTAVLALAAWAVALEARAQESAGPRYRVDVNLVALTFTVTDSGGRPIHGLKASDIQISEDGVLQKITGFAEGGGDTENALPGIPPGTAVFILLDTSNRMYNSIPYACDAIADFVRHLDPADPVAIYTFSRNLSRAAPLTCDRTATRAGLAQNVSIGDDTALFDCLLLTLRDAARVPGRKAVVVFSNGPDNHSMLSPEDVGTVAVNEGIPVYVLSTLDPVKDRITATALERLADSTGGKLYVNHDWRKQIQPLTLIREQIGGSYTAFYYPGDSSNEGFRQVRIEVVRPGGKTYTVRSRMGYQPRKRSASGSD